MAKEYTLYIQKTKQGSSAKSSLDFGFAVCELPWPELKTKDVAKRDWPGEHGESSYIPPGGLKFKSYDLEVEFCYKGELGTAYKSYIIFRDFLIGIDGDGAKLNLYDPLWDKGCASAYLTEISDIEPSRSAVDDTLVFKAKFHVADPMTDIIAGTNSKGEIISLEAGFIR